MEAPTALGIRMPRMLAVHLGPVEQRKLATAIAGVRPGQDGTLEATVQQVAAVTPRNALLDTNAHCSGRVRGVEALLLLFYFWLRSGIVSVQWKFSSFFLCVFMYIWYATRHMCLCDDCVCVCVQEFSVVVHF